MNYFARNLKFLFKKFNTNQAQLALYVGKGQSTVSNWLSGKTEPDISFLIKIREFFGVSLDYLVFENLETGNLITNEHVETFHRDGNLNRNPIGNPSPLLNRNFVVQTDQPGLEVVELWAIIGSLQQLHEKIDNLTLMTQNGDKGTKN